MPNLQTKTASTPKPSFASASTGLLQRKCACGNHASGGECAECGEKKLSLQRSTRNPELETREPDSVPPIVHEVRRSPGQPLDPATRAFMEPRFRHDFSQVRVHTDARAAESAREVNALAYTVGSNIVLASGQYSPTTLAGKKLLAHELTHVLQQSAAGPLGIQRQAAETENQKPTETPSANTPVDAPAAAPVSDAEIDALDLGATAKAGAQELKKKHSGISFTSGRRNVAEQAHAMASNIVSSKDRKWIENTPYPGATALQKWVNDNPKATTVDEISKGLEDTMNGMSSADLGKVSKHLSGEAFDVQPQEADAGAIKKDIKALSGLSKFLEKEGGLVRWHAQFKLAGFVARTDDPLEHQADLVAEQVCRADDLSPYAPGNSFAGAETNMGLDNQARAALTSSFAATDSGALERKCACGGTSGVTSEWEDCDKQKLSLLRSTENPELATRNSEVETQDSGGVPPIVHEVLRSPGQPLDPRTRAFMEPRFGHDFSRVRIHTDEKAAESAQSVNALAYTVGQRVILGSAYYGLDQSRQRHVMAHELAHVVQQSAVSQSEQTQPLTVGARGDSYEQEAERVAMQMSGATKELATSPKTQQRAAGLLLSRVNAAETAGVLRTGTVAGSGLQFYPTHVAGTRVGPVSGEGGLVGDTSSNRLSVIIGQNLTLNQVATILLPLWQTATPFTPPGASAPVTPQAITAADLARGLLAYNQYYLPVPTMTRWKAGLRFPLPIEIDVSTNEGTLHPNLIQSLASGFEPAWEALLAQPAVAPTAPAQADMGTAVTSFLSTETSATGRGIILATRAITNAHEDSPFILEAFTQLGTGAFDVALEFMNHSVNHQIGLLASERDGAGILARIRTILAAPPATLTQDQQTNLRRAIGMLGLVAGVAARETPVYQPQAQVQQGGHTTSEAGAQFVADWEQYRQNLYNDQANHCTIGYGTLVHRGPCDGTESAEFRAGITEPRARELLMTRVEAAADVVNQAVTVALTQNQFDALVTFAYNVGLGGFRGSTLLTELNNGQYDAVPNQMNRWTHAGGAVSAGLVTRRQREGDMFRDGTYNSAH